jgi:hypothetical protein
VGNAFFYSVFKLLLFPVQVSGMHPEKEINVTDNIKGFYTKLEKKGFIKQLGNCG